MMNSFSTLYELLETKIHLMGFKPTEFPLLNIRLSELDIRLTKFKSSYVFSFNLLARPKKFSTKRFKLKQQNEFCCFFSFFCYFVVYLPPSQGKLSANTVNNLSASRQRPLGPKGTRHTGHLTERLRQLLHNTCPLQHCQPGGRMT